MIRVSIATTGVSVTALIYSTRATELTAPASFALLQSLQVMRPCRTEIHSAAAHQNTRVTNQIWFVTLVARFVEPLFVGEGGLEPPRPEGHWHLKPARLPFRHSPE